MQTQQTIHPYPVVFNGMTESDFIALRTFLNDCMDDFEEVAIVGLGRGHGTADLVVVIEASTPPLWHLMVLASIFSDRIDLEAVL